jgi:hypothetical protein
MSVDNLHAALRQKFKTSTDAMHALGLNPNLLHDQRKPTMRRRYAHDAVRRVGDAEPMSVPDALQAIREILANCEDGDALAASIVDELNGTNEIGEPSPAAEAEDRRRRAMGLDARPRHMSASQERSFYERFPNAARIGFM